MEEYFPIDYMWKICSLQIDFVIKSGALFKGQLVIYTKKEITELYDTAVNSSIAIKKCSVSQIPSIYS